MIRLCGAAVMLAVAAPPAHHLPDRQSPHSANPRKASPTFARAHREHHRARTHATFRQKRVGLDPVLYREWTRVAICEEGGWVGWSGPAFPDSLGITAANWFSHGGTSDVSPQAQIAVAERIQTWVPDQDGCAPW
jgi:hypothetical protein